jgi:hypothetical protein
MSVETLALLALFLVLPLIQLLMQARRQRSQPGSEQADRRSAAARGRQVPPGSVVQARPDTPLDAVTDALGAGTGTPAHPRRSVTPASRSDRIMRPLTATDLDHRHGLRRAIVLMALLGPCRARDPYDWPEQAGRS